MSCPSPNPSIAIDSDATARAWLIGAGPGDAELLTLKAVRALAQADVVLVDDLVNPDMLQWARAQAQIVHVGKRGGRPSTPQADIVASMLTHLRAGRSVVRLKGGDPFVFGRGGEELQALRDAGVQVEIVSGITAGIAAPAALGIPVTHRGFAQGAVFVTGHGAGEDEPDWRALAATQLTLVIYMGMRRLEAIVAALLQAGMASSTPCAAIASATLPAQRHVLASLEALPRAVNDAQLGAPAIVVIGEVVSLANVVDAAPSVVSSRDASPALTLGIGCKRGVTVAQIEAAVHAALGAHTMHRIVRVATIAAKADEPALIEYCARRALPLVTFDIQDIEACLAQHETLARSATVHAHAHVDGVCEPCALLAAPGGHLLVRKHVLDGVTVAAAVAVTAAPGTTTTENQRGGEYAPQRTL